MEPMRSREYQRAHKAVIQMFGSARKYQCVHCGEQAFGWAYRHDSATRLVIGPLYKESGRPYSLDPHDYMPLCSRCHISYDRFYRTFLFREVRDQLWAEAFAQ
jgi:NAD-dependent SIR2 family protein deacetylase